MVKLCTDYKRDGVLVYSGCGQPLKYVIDQPPVQTGINQWGKPQFKGRYFHYDGTPSNHSLNNPPSQQAYQQTYSPIIEKEDQEQAQILAQGFKEATSNAYAEKFITTAVERITEAVKAAHNAEDKTHSTNISVATIGKNIDDLSQSVGEMRDEFKLLHEKVDAALAAVSFQGADKMYQKQQEEKAEAEEFERNL